VSFIHTNYTNNAYTYDTSDHLVPQQARLQDARHRPEGTCICVYVCVCMCILFKPALTYPNLSFYHYIHTYTHTHTYISSPHQA
jgi:hypothetical protein